MFDKFFSNISGKIKLVAKIMLVFGIIGAIACLITSLVFFADGYEEIGAMTLLIGVPASILVVLVPSWFVYGFGQLIENTGNEQSNTPQVTTPVTKKQTGLGNQRFATFLDNLNKNAYILAFIFGVIALISILFSGGPIIRTIYHDYDWYDGWTDIVYETKFLVPYIVTILSALACVAVSVVNLWVKKQEKIVNIIYPIVSLVMPFILALSTFSQCTYIGNKAKVYIVFYVSIAILVALLLRFFGVNKKTVDIVSWVVLICALICMIYTFKVTQVYSCIISQMSLLLLNFKSEITIKNINIQKGLDK